MVKILGIVCKPQTAEKALEIIEPFEVLSHPPAVASRIGFVLVLIYYRGQQSTSSTDYSRAPAAQEVGGPRLDAASPSPKGGFEKGDAETNLLVKDLT